MSGINQAPPPETAKVPRVSIGMPVYNGEKYIREALDSLLSQTFNDFELIISDNASTDGTESICREYAARDARICYVRQPANMGGAANFQFVLNSARADTFMWAAHDDKWTKNYLFNATALLSDASIDFVFPSFELRSIQLHVGKRFDMSIFAFIESTNIRQRILQFLTLHHDSHKCNIVYALFRKEFLIAAHTIQSIRNDGALGAVILSRGRGKIVNEAYFIKRYPKLWPGALSFIHSRLHKGQSNGFALAKRTAFGELAALFPEYAIDIQFIFDCYREYEYESCYRICSIGDDSNERQNQ